MGAPRPPVKAMIAFIDDHRGAYGVEPICKVLPIAPSTYFDHRTKQADPTKLSARARRDARLRPKINLVFEQNLKVYGARKVWLQINREGFSVARYTVERLMRVMGLHGVIRGKAIRTTTPDKAAPCPLDHVNRQFHAPAPNRLWVSEFASRTFGSPMSAPGAASSMWPSSSMPMPGGLLAGAYRERHMRASCSMPLSKPYMSEDQPIAAVWCIILTGDRNTSAFDTASGSPKLG